MKHKGDVVRSRGAGTAATRCSTMRRLCAPTCRIHSVKQCVKPQSDVAVIRCGAIGMASVGKVTSG